MKKALSILLALVMTLSLAACGGESSSSGGSDDEAALFSQGLLSVCIDGRWGYINESGELVINPRCV